jgi:hypothetical protein
MGRWKVQAVNGESAIRVCGRALSGASESSPELDFSLTPDQANELISRLNLALLELQLSIKRA